MICKFHEATHTYTMDAKEVPGCTEVLADTGLREMFFDNEHSADKGTKIHLALHYLDTVGLNPDSVDPKIRPYIDAYLQWQFHSQAEILESEYIVYNEVERYGCIIDKIARFNIMDQVVHGIVEVKTGIPQGSDQLQTGAQTLAMGTGPWSLPQEGDRPDYVIAGGWYLRRWVLHLTDRGTFKLVENTEQDDINIFRSACHVYWGKRRYL